MNDFTVAIGPAQSGIELSWRAISATPPTPSAGTYLWTGSGWGTPTGDALVIFANCLKTALGSNIYIYDGSVGGTSLLQADAIPSSPNNWWLYDVPGSILNNLAGSINAAGQLPSCFLMDIGQTDGGAGCLQQNFSDAAQLCYGKLMQKIGGAIWDADANIPMFINVTGRITYQNATIESTMSGVRTAQMQLPSFNKHMIVANSYVDVPVNADQVHPTIGGAMSCARRTAQTIANHYNPASYPASGVGPQIVSGTIHNATITLNVVGNQTVLSPAVNPTISPTGFEVSNNGFSSNLAISDIFITDHNTITIELASGAGGSVQVRYQYGAAPDVSNCLYGGNTPFGDVVPLPVLPTIGFITLTSD